MPDVKEAVALVTDPANVTRMRASGPEENFAVNQNRVIKALREAGAGKAEARELALQALEKVEGGAAIHASRGAQATARRGDDGSAEQWWVPREAVRFEQ